MVELNEEQGDLFRYWLSDDAIARMSADTLELVYCATETLFPNLSPETVKTIQARAAELLAETTSLQGLGYLRYWVDISERFNVCLATEIRFDRIAYCLGWINEQDEGAVCSRVRELAEAMPFPELAAELDCLSTLSDTRSLVVSIIGNIMRERAKTVEEILAALCTTSNATIITELADRLENRIAASITGADAETPAS